MIDEAARLHRRTERQAAEAAVIGARKSNASSPGSPDPGENVTASEVDKLKDLEAELKATGQAEAERVVEAVKRSRAGFREPDKPVASLLSSPDRRR